MDSCQYEPHQWIPRKSCKHVAQLSSPFPTLDNFLTYASPDEASLAWDLPKGVLVVVLELRGKNTTFLSLSSHEAENTNFSLFLSLLSHYTQLIGVEGQFLICKSFSLSYEQTKTNLNLIQFKTFFKRFEHMQNMYRQYAKDIDDQCLD